MWFNVSNRGKSTFEFMGHPKEENNNNVVDNSRFPKLPEQAGIYQLTKINNKLELIYESNIIKTEELIFGDVAKRVIREWTRFCNYPESVGSLNVGDQGSGKSNKCDILANLAVIKGNLPVIKVTGFEVSDLEIQFFQGLNNCCLYLDEFSKHFRYSTQQNMLSLLSNNNKKFLVLYTDNDKGNINRYILDRTQRARYKEEFGKLSEKAVTDFLSLFEVRKEFKEEFLERYKKAIVFSIDNLKAIVSEHIDWPDDTLDEILSYLNVSALSKKTEWKLFSVETTETNAEGKEEIVKLDNSLVRQTVLNIEDLKSGTAIEIDRRYNRLSKSNVVSMLGGELTLRVDKYVIVYKEKEEE